MEFDFDALLEELKKEYRIEEYRARAAALRQEYRCTEFEQRLKTLEWVRDKLCGTAPRASTPRRVLQRPNSPPPPTLRKLIEEMLPTLPAEFTRLNLMEKIKERYPEKAETIKGSSMRWTLQTLVESGDIEVMRPGENNEPTMYQHKKSGGGQERA